MKEHSVLPPGMFVAEELKLLAMQGMKGVGNPEKSYPINCIVCN